MECGIHPAHLSVCHSRQLRHPCTDPRRYRHAGIAPLDDAVSSLLPAATPMVSANPMQIYLGIAQFFWQIGIVVMFLWGMISLFLLVRRLWDAAESERGVFISAHIDTPFVLGRRIYLPAGITANQRKM
ncbi:MAG: hypothetical protein IJF67_18165, partial [Clostridia bacterium]|nr:hypothetical protein [Clostridia bacterium]